MTACFFEVCSNICLGMGQDGEEHPLAGKALPSMVKTHKELLLNTVKHMLLNAEISSWLFSNRDKTLAY